MTAPILGFSKERGLHYDYDNQCWVKHGVFLKCGHREKVPLCFSCSHHGEEHFCTEDCLEQLQEKI